MMFAYSLMLSAILIPAQAATQSQQATVDELKAIRTTMERVEKSQRMLVALMRIQIDEGRLAPIELQRRTLAGQELALTQEIDRLTPVLQREAAGSGAIVSAAGSDPALARVDPNSARVRYDEATRKLEEIRGTIRSLNESASSLRSQIAQWEKIFLELSR